MKTFTIALLAVLLVGCKSAPTETAPVETSETSETTEAAATKTADEPAPAANGDDMGPPTGAVTRADIIAAEPKWGEIAEAWTPNADAVATLNGANDVRIEVWLGTWCGDSRREVSRFFGVMDELEGGPEVQFRGVDRSMMAGDYSIPSTLTNVPTFYVYRGDEEIGRVVETAVEPIEVDLADIVSGKRTGFISASVEAP